MIVSGLGLCMLIFFWLPLYNKVFLKAEKWQKHKKLTTTPILKFKKLKELNLTEVLIFLLSIRICDFLTILGLSWKLMILICLVILIIIFVVNFKILTLKIIRWLAEKHNYFEKNKNKKWVKRIHAYGHFGLYFFAVIPFLFHPVLCAYKIFIQSRFGFLCIWLGGVTRLALWIFCGFKLINLL